MYKLMRSFFSNFKLVFEILAETTQKKKKKSNKWRGVNIDQSEMY